MNANAWWRRALRWMADVGLPEHRCEARYTNEEFFGGFPIEVGEPVPALPDCYLDWPGKSEGEPKPGLIYFRGERDIPRDPLLCRVAFRELLPPGCSLRKDAVLEACTEWLRGCSCAPTGRPWECEACTEPFHGRLKALIGSDTP